MKQGRPGEAKPLRLCPPLTAPAWCLASFTRCIPSSFRQQIRQHSVLTRLRLRSVFRRFVRTFRTAQLSRRAVMVKYLATLEHLAPRFGAERIPVRHLELLCQADREPPAAPDPASSPGPPTHEVLVTGTGGIQWRPVQPEVSRAPPTPGLWVGLARGLHPLAGLLTPSACGQAPSALAGLCPSACGVGQPSSSWVHCLRGASVYLLFLTSADCSFRDGFVIWVVTVAGDEGGLKSVLCCLKLWLLASVFHPFIYIPRPFH